MMEPAEVFVARRFVTWSLGLFVLLAAPLARAGDKGGPPVPAPTRTLADQLRDEWRAAGLGAVRGDDQGAMQPQRIGEQGRGR